jgi:outer membrane protein assembly factor BamB
VLVAGKMGVVYAYRADNGELLWTLPVGRHQNDVGDLPADQVTVFPGLLGGVIASMALAKGRLFVSWLDLSTDMSSTTINPSFIANLATGTGALAAVGPRTGRVLWRRDLPKIDLGGATVSNDVVFTSTYDGTIYAFDVDNGDLLWTATARAGINSFPAIAGDMVFVGAAAPGFFNNPVQELIAYGL